MRKCDWTDEQIQILKEEYKKNTPIPEIASIIGKSTNSIKIKASRLNITKSVNKPSKPHRDLSNQKFGKLTALYPINRDIYNAVIWHCVCECGNETDVSEYNLLNKHTKSCGCISIENCKKNFKKYNHYEEYDDYIVGYTETRDTFLFDKQDYELIKNHCWRVNTSGYILSVRDDHTIMFHRLILGMYDSSEYDNLDVDHINGDKTDNRRKNLRIVTRSQNNMNRKLQSNNTSGVTGVSLNTKNNKWVAQIELHGKHIHLGEFDNFEDAVNARIKGEEKYFGEYSFRNSRRIYNEYKSLEILRY